MPASDHPRREAEATEGPGFAYVDGRFCPIGDAHMPLVDWGILRSDATYDVVKVTDGRFFRLEDHLARLRRGAGMLGLRIAESWDDVRSILAECVAQADLETCVAYALVTRGVPPLGMSRDPRHARNRLYAMALPVPWLIEPDDQDRALSVALGSRRRIDPASVDPTIKNFHWQDLIQSARGAFAKGADSTILLDLQGNVTEGPGFNVFVVRNGTLVTPAEGVLQGITRKTVLEIATGLGLPSEETTVSTRELQAADEVFGTSTAGGVVPIGTLDGKSIGDGRPGPITRRMRAHLAECQRAPEYTTNVGDARSSAGVLSRVGP